MTTIVERLGGLEVEIGELVEQHKGSKARDFTRYANDPVGFIRDVLGEKNPGPWSKQIEIANAVRDHPFVAVAGCNASGKDWLAARLALWWVYACNGLAIVTGPTQKQVAEIVFGEVARAWKHNLPGELFQLALRLGREEQRGIVGLVSNDVSRLTGFHAPRVMAILTEAQGVPPMAWEAMISCRTGDDDKTLAVGNPLDPAGPFFDKSRSDHWRFIEMPATEHPNVIEARTVVPGGPTRSWCETIEREYGKGSNTYLSRVLAKFPMQGEEALFSRIWLETAVTAHKTGAFAAQAQNSCPVVAVDPARYGPDSTAYACRRGPVLDRITTWHGLDLMETVARVEQEATADGLRPRVPDQPKFPAVGIIVVDVVGMGAGCFDRLKEKGWNVQAYSGGTFTSSSERKRFINTRSASHWHLRMLLEAGEIALPRDELAFDELLAVQWRPDPADARITIEPKKDLKSRLGRSPDRADAIVMAYSNWGRNGNAPRFLTVRYGKCG